MSRLARSRLYVVIIIIGLSNSGFELKINLILLAMLAFTYYGLTKEDT